MVSLILPKTQKKDSLLSRKMLNHKIYMSLILLFDHFFDARVEIREHFLLGLIFGPQKFAIKSFIYERSAR